MSRRKTQRGATWHVVFLACLATVMLVVCFVWGALNWSYSDGERAGVLQKFSRRGWLCKTYEGELALYVVAGVQPEVWDFSVRSDAVARQLEAAVGERVQLHYTEHRGVPTSCFGETGYYVDRINSIGATVPSVTAPAPPPAPTLAPAPASPAPVPVPVPAPASQPPVSGRTSAS